MDKSYGKVRYSVDGNRNNKKNDRRNTSRRKNGNGTYESTQLI